MLTSSSRFIIDGHTHANKDCRLVEKEIVYQGQRYVLDFFCCLNTMKGRVRGTG